MTIPRPFLLLVLGATVTGQAAPAVEPLSYSRDVKPILSAHCFNCHGAKKQKGGLRLDEAKAALAGGNSGPAFVAGKSGESKLVHAAEGTDPDSKMPPEGPPLRTAEVATLRTWIDQGAGYDDTQTVPQSTVPVRSSHWAFQPIKRPPVPEARIPNSAYHNEIDAFVQSRLKKEGLTPSPEADRATLARRLYLDLLGLPPAPKDVDEFVNDASSDAYEKLVDKLLASPHYGERWGRHWLDAARYADSDGYEKDTGRPFAWRYRDWVINALNADVPFDRFTVEQLAGDLLPNATLDQKIATGFHRNTLTNKEGGVDQEEFRVAACVDRVSTTAQVWLGLTLGCAQCHDHKYDPVSQREFYQFFAYFNSDLEADLLAPFPSEMAKLQPMMEAYDRERLKLIAAVQDGQAKKLPFAELNKREKALIAHIKKVPPGSKVMTLASGPVRPTNVMIRGDFLRKGVEVTPGTPAVLRQKNSEPAIPGRSGTRLELAKWLVAPTNPLTPRVTVNWVWAKFFGRGIVATLEDFGTQGDKPTHPELLDWLADEFRASPGCGWSLKKLHRLIVTSATYRQSSATPPSASDPLNVLLSRQSRLRLEAEIVRDGALAASGLLTRTVGGPSVRPPQPAGISELTYANAAKWVESVGPERFKRGLYVWFQRTSPYPMLMTFDSPDSNVCTVRRERSNTPLQALTMLNDAVFVESAQALARRVQSEAKASTPRQQVSLAFRLCLGREPTPEEQERLLKFHEELTRMAAKNPAEAAKLIGPYKSPGAATDRAAAWVGLARMLLNLDEFVTRE